MCWSNQPNPIVSGNHSIAGTGAGTFSCEIVDLEPNTIYYVRAYAINSMGVGYGNEVNFTTLSSGGGGVSAPEGAIGGIFSVSAMDKVYFSQGNLQYQASTNTWRFAEKQYYTIGESNCNISSTYSGWIDLFGWGTSGWNNGNVYYRPWDSQNNGNYNHGLGYGPTDGTKYIYNLTGVYSNADWGVYNSISNGGNQIGMWRTLMREEWMFLLTTRYTSSGIRYAKAQVNGVNGVILVPDNWNVSTFNLSNTNELDASFTDNIVSEMVWTNTIEPAGAVFLPAASYRNGTSVSVGGDGCYWSASQYNNNNAYYSSSAYCVEFSYGGLYIERYLRYYGLSVRLVCPVE